MEGIRLDDLKDRARDYARHLVDVKQKVEPPPWGWYPPVLPDFIDIIDSLLVGEHRAVIEDGLGRPMADVGAADGDLGFFLRECGFDVDLYEGGPSWVREQRLVPPTRMKAALESPAEVHGIDLDREFTLAREYHLIFFLGVLYHLRNPLLVLEQLARSTEYCIVSTKVARYVPTRRFGRRARLEIQHLPLAYLADAYEIDSSVVSNHWIFSEASLRLACKRSGWEVLDYKLVGNPNAEPGSPAEGRAWCLLHSEIRGSKFSDAMRLAIDRRSGSESFDAFVDLLDD